MADRDVERYPFEHPEVYEPGPFTGQGAYVCVQAAFGPSVESSLCSFLRIDELDRHLHCTIMYCAKRQCSPGLKRFELPALIASVPISGFEYWDGHDDEGYIVAVLDSPLMKERNAFWTSVGLKHSFDDYTAHVTLRTGAPAKALKTKIEAINEAYKKRAPFLLTLFHETIEDCKGFGK